MNWCSIIGVNAMRNEAITLAEVDEEIPSRDIPDEVLERAGNAEQTAFTLFYCTNHWYSCNLPQ
jgi:hypothetical protein